MGILQIVKEPQLFTAVIEQLMYSPNIIQIEMPGQAQKRWPVAARMSGTHDWEFASPAASAVPAPAPCKKRKERGTQNKF